nr:hypothetical protein [Tanacetum cinerariifolium]
MPCTIYLTPLKSFQAEKWRGGSDNHRSSNNNYSSSNNRNSGNRRDQRNRGHQSNRSANSGSQQSKGPSEGYSYPVCTTCGRRHQGDRPLSRVVTGTTVIITTVIDQTGEVVVTTIAVATTTTLAVTTEILVKGVTREIRVSSPTDLPILVPSSPRVPLKATPTQHPGECRRATGTCFKCGQAGHLQKDCKKNTTAGTSGQADKKPGTSGRVFAITEGHAANTSGFLATIHDMTPEIPCIHDQPIVSEFPDVFPDELPGIPPVR